MRIALASIAVVMLAACGGTDHTTTPTTFRLKCRDTSFTTIHDQRVFDCVFGGRHICVFNTASGARYLQRDQVSADVRDQLTCMNITV